MRFAFPTIRSVLALEIGLATVLVVAARGHADSLPTERISTSSELPPQDEASPHRVVPREPPRFRFEAQGGLVRWKWNEVVPALPQLEERGSIPMAKVRGTWRVGPVRMGASLELLSGAIAYDGYLQDRSTASLVPYRSRTNYLAATPSIAIQYRHPGGLEWVRPTVSLSRPWWRRTIDSESDRSPGRFGYVEVWSVVSSGFGVEVERTFPRNFALSILGEVQVPHSTTESIGSTNSPIRLEPKTRTGGRWNARLTYRDRFLLEFDALRVGFDESDMVRSGGQTEMFVFQPESSLDRVAWTVGMIF